MMASVHPDQLQAWDARDTDRLYRLIADSIPQLVWATAPDGDADYFNARLLAYTGLSPDQLAGQRWREIIHADDRERVLAAWNKAARDGERYTIECRLRRADGAYRWHHVSALPLRGRDGRVVRWFGTCTEIEDQVRNARLLETAVEERTLALRSSEALKSAILDAALDAIITMDHEGRIVEFNPAAEKCFGLRRDAAVGRSMADLIVPPDVRARHWEGLRRYIATGESRILGTRLEMPALRADGSRFDAELTIVRIPGSEPPVFTGTLRDITERSRLEEALRQSEQRFRSFMEHAPAVAWIKDARFRYTYVNRTYELVYGRSAAEVLGREDFDLHAPELARAFRAEDERIQRSGEAAQKLHEVPYADGRPAHWVVVKFPLADAAGETSVAGIALDVTARLEAEEKARRYADEVGDLVKRLVQAQEAERRRVADELHDLIGQNLTALGIDLQALKQRLQSGGDLIAGPRLDAMAALLDTTIDAIRGVMTDLRPAALEEFGLVPALRWHASQFSKRTGMKVSTHTEGRDLRLPQETELTLFRIVQEALTNAAKHSGGTAVDIAVVWRDGRLRVTVEDDGRGFAQPVGARRGFGLPTMRERAEAHGGLLRVEFPQRGTRVTVEIPTGMHAD